MPVLEINREPSRRELLWFGGLLSSFLALLGVVVYWRFSAGTAARVLWALGPLVALLYYGVPPLRKPLYLAWTYAVYPLGWVVSHLLLAIVYYLVLTPIGLILRLSGRDAATRRFDPDAKTYWIKRQPVHDPARYFKRF